MEKIEPTEQKSDLNLVGFEKVFVQIEQSANNEQIKEAANIHEQVHELDVDSHEMVTMAEAARRLNMPYPTLRRQVMAGKIPSSLSVDGKQMVKLMVGEQSVKGREQPKNKNEQSGLPSEYSLTIQSLLKQVEAERGYSKSLNEKLEAANHRNGYLEAHVDLQKEQIKLLTDSQHKSGWWSRFSAWFMGRG